MKYVGAAAMVAGWLMLASWVIFDARPKSSLGVAGIACMFGGCLIEVARPRERDRG